MAVGITTTVMARRKLEEKFHKMFAWYPTKLTSGRWIFGKPYWVRYYVIVNYYDGAVAIFERSKAIEKIDSEEMLLRALSER